MPTARAEYSRDIPDDLDPVAAQILLNLALAGHLAPSASRATIERSDQIVADYDRWLATRRD